MLKVDHFLQMLAKFNISIISWTIAKSMKSLAVECVLYGMHCYLLPTYIFRMSVFLTNSFITDIISIFVRNEFIVLKMFVL